MDIWPRQTESMLKLGLSLLPALAGLLAARALARHGHMTRMTRLWSGLSVALGAATAAAVLAGLIIWIIA